MENREMRIVEAEDSHGQFYIIHEAESPNTPSWCSMADGIAIDTSTRPVESWLETPFWGPFDIILCKGELRMTAQDQLSLLAAISWIENCSEQTKNSNLELIGNESVDAVLKH